MSNHWGRAGQALGPCAQRSSLPLLALPGRILHGASASAGPGALGCSLLGSPLPAVVRRTPSSSSVDMVGSAVMWHWYPAPTAGSGYRGGGKGQSQPLRAHPSIPRAPPALCPGGRGNPESSPGLGSLSLPCTWTPGEPELGWCLAWHWGREAEGFWLGLSQSPPLLAGVQAIALETQFGHAREWGGVGNSRVYGS